MHGVRFPVISYDPERFLRRIEQPVGAGERLDQCLVTQEFVQIQSIHPPGIKSCEHLIHHDQQVDLFVRIIGKPSIGGFVGQTQRNVFFVGRVGGQRIVHAVSLVIILQDIHQTVLFE